MPVARSITPPYYAAIFTSLRSSVDPSGYAETAERMERLAKSRPGFLGIESVRGADGRGVTVSYWSDLESLRDWGRDAEHLTAQAKGRAIWYEEFRLEICRVEAARTFAKSNEGKGFMDQELFERFARGPAAYRRATEGLTRDELLAKPGPGTWSIQELVVHLADSDAVLIDRMKRVAAEERPTLMAFDENKWLERLAPAEQSLDDALALFEINRRQIARVLRSLPTEAWSRQGVHSEAGELTLADLFGKSVKHAEHHLKFLLAKRETLGKPITLDAAR